MYDIHSHLLPGVDDGAKDMEEAVAIARQEVKQGIKGVIATPHYLDNGFQLNPEETIQKVRELGQVLEDRGIELELYPGAEVLISADLGKKVSGGFVPTLNNSKYILIEFPFTSLPVYTDKVLYDLLVMGYVPVIAHPERYQYIHENPGILYSLVEDGIHTQLNTGSLLGYYGSRVRESARILLEHNLIHLIGSDLHSAEGKKGYLTEGFQRLKEITPYAGEIIQNNERLVKNQELHRFELKEFKREGFLSRLKRNMRKKRN